VNDSRMPAVFIGHGSPMNALEDNRYTVAWSELAGSLPKPRAIVCVSAHWFINASAVTAMAQPRTIHDFFGFPQALFDVRYPAPGSPELAQQVVDAAAPMWIGLDLDSWGLDHGAWSVLARMYPAADIPVVQLSVDASKAQRHHFDIGAKLDALRSDGVLVVCSGNIVHNLPMIDPALGTDGFDWAQRFDERVRELMTSGACDELLALPGHPDYDLAVPTPDHYLPLLYLAGIASAAASKARVVIDGYGYGSLSMTSYVVD
jgi:4,5-DOPA dioxygenase extradiol